MGGMGEERDPDMYSYVPRATVRPARKVCTAFLTSVRGRLRAEGINAQISSVGSAKHNMVTRDGDQPFDLDYDVLISSPGIGQGALKETVLAAVRKAAPAYGFRKVQDSTSAITCIHRRDGTDAIDFHLDIGIIVMRDEDTGCRLIHDKDRNTYFLNEPVHFRDLEERVAVIKRYNKKNELRKIYLEKKNGYLKKGDRDHPSFVVYVEAVDQVYQKITGKGGIE